ncbi:MAG: tRNA pseudouridine(13) synthase TruD [Candidatus Micrarchaeota archaeon]
MKYLSKSPGIGGQIKSVPEDFIVEEISIDGTVLELDKLFEKQDEEGNFVHFVLQKRNWSTSSALNEIAKKFHMSQKNFNTAGMKDKVSISTQIASVSGITKEKLLETKIKDISINGAWTAKERVSIGDLLGNRFTITVRDYSEKSNDCSEAIIADLNGQFPNYFGEQRFGSTRRNTHLVGQRLIEGKIEDALFMFLCDSATENNQEARLAREELLETRDFNTALKSFPKYLTLERSILMYLSKHPTNYLTALRSLPRNILLLFIHSFQSHLFNLLLSDRIAEGEIQLEEGEYFCGETFGFPDVEKIEGNGWITGKIIGYNTYLSDREKNIMESFNLTKDHFRVKEIPELASKGTRRTLFSPLKDFSCQNNFFKFSLPAGSYATVAMREFLDKTK